MKRALTFVVLALSASAISLGAACSSAETEAAPTRPAVPVTPVADASDEDAAVVDPGCLGPGGCFKCEPVAHVEILNSCAAGQCTPFDNAARLPLYKAGQPLPPVP